MPVKRPLFISLTRTCIGYRDGRISQEQLSSGIYYFGCARQFAYSPINSTAESKDFLARCLSPGGTTVINEAMLSGIHEAILISLKQAERANRCRFRPDNGVATYGQLNELLMANGYETIMADPDEPITRDDQMHDIAYAVLRDRIRGAGINLEVIY